MKKFTIMMLITLVLFSVCKISSDIDHEGNGGGIGIDLDDEVIDGGTTDPSDPTDPSGPVDPSGPAGIVINIVMSGNIDGDSVISLSDYGKPGEEITLNYTLADTKQKNRIVFSGTTPAVEEVDIAGSGDRKYVIAEDDASEGVITINALFTHTDKLLDTIEFANTSNEEIVYGGSLTKAITNTGSGTGAISYASSDKSVATVNNSGAVTIHSVGTATITAAKAADAVYEKAEARYTLTVTPLQLTIAPPEIKSKIYNGTTTANIAIGALKNKVGNDTVTVTAAANYNSADVANANMITVVYTISGASADNYIKPVDFEIEGKIQKAPGGTVNTNPEAQIITSTSITSKPVTTSTVQKAEYAKSTTTAVPSTGWQETLIFSGLTPNTGYYLFARAKENDNYLTGAEVKISSKITTDLPSITVKITMTGKTGSDNVTATPLSGKAGTEITLNYTLDKLNANNRLAFSGTSTAIEEVYGAGTGTAVTGTRTYVIKEADADQSIITINAVFTHAELVLDTIAFANSSNEEKVYGPGTFTKVITNTGSGTGTITYASSDTSVAAVTNSGVVTLVKVGTATITATKAADANYAQTTASYTLTVTKLQLTIANPTLTTSRPYNGTTTADITAVGALNNKVGSDAVTVEAEAKFNSANVADANLITVEYSISGANAGNYIRPVNYTVPGTITKATGAAVSGSPTEVSSTANSITVNAVNIPNNNGNQTVEYAKAETTTAPENGWQDGTTFTGLTANTGYYIFARSKANANYDAGTAKVSTKITTELMANTISFPAPLSESKVYGTSFTKALSVTGSGSGAVTYSSSDTSIATVDSNGVVTLKKAGGPITIKATKAENGGYAQATAEYTLTVTQLQLTIADPGVTTTKVYNNNTTAAVTAGALTNKVGSDTVNVSATAAYNSADVASANLITVTYTISGANAGNYIKPVNYTVAGTITKANGASISGTPSASSSSPVTSTSITVSSSLSISGTNPGSQTIEYAISTTSTPVPTSGWQNDKTFSNLTPSTDYYIFARAKETANYNAGAASTSAKITTTKATITVNIVKSGNTGSDNVTVSPASGTDGTSVTLSYTLDKTNARNRLTFSGTTAVIEEVNSAGTGTAVTGTKTYVIREADSTEYKVTINAIFIHSALELNTIAFADNNNETKVYGSASFTKAITNTGSGSGTISYASSDTSVATVNSGTGAVTIVKVGETTITATKAADATYAQATASYSLTITPLQLTKANPTVAAKTFDGNTTATLSTVGALNNVKSGDTVSLSYEANFASANAGSNIAITVVYTISGASADNYIAPVNYNTTGTINKATGGTISGTVSGTSTSATSITANAASIAGLNSGGQTVEYAVSASSTTASGWQDELVFTGLTTGNEYYIHARSKANDNYSAGTAKQSAKIKVDYQADTIAFADTNNETKEYGSAFTKAITNTGSGTGAITYTSSSTGVATVDSATGAVTIVKTGTTTITATKAKDTIYGQTTASYTLTVTQRQLTIADPTVTTTKTYNGNTTAEVTAGSLTNKVGNDNVTITAAANYNTADAGTGKTITVVYTMSGTSSSNYIKPVDYTTSGTITKADGAATSSQSGGTPSAASKTATSITSTTVAISQTNPGSQTIEYAIAKSTTLPTSGWQDDKTFNNLTPNTDYYIFARAKETTNYNAGAAKTSAAIKTDLQANNISFNAPLEANTVYGTDFTKAIASGSSGTGAVTYAPSDTSVATVDNNGKVTPKKVGTVTITATKAADATYAQATASYTLTITALQLTKANPTVAAKTYDGTTTATLSAVGALNNVKSGDTVNVAYEANFASANAGSNIGITVVYTISGASAGNYIAPVNYTTTGTISKAAGGTVTAPVYDSKTSSSITVNAITTATGQIVEYAAATNTTTPTTGWTDSTTIGNLSANTPYYLYARAKSNDNYNTGAVARTTTTTTTSLSNNIIAFSDPLEVSAPYGANFTKALSTTGSGNGAITYASSDETIATVNNSGVVTPVKAGGPIIITATKAAQGNFASATASYTLTITKAAGGTVTVPTVASKSSTSITVNTVTAPSGQTVEYAAATGTTAPTTGWTDSATITGLSASTAYYVYARAKENDNYNVGTAQRSTSATTTDALTNTIAFESATVSKPYGTDFTITLSNTGSGTGAITYASSETSVATVTNAGVVTPKKVGTTVITATKAAQGGYPQATAAYSLTITALQLTISNPTITASKKYDGTTTAAVTKGTVTGVKSGDTVTVNAAANYTSADVGTGKTITVVYTLTGTSAGNYAAPVDYTVTNGVITKGDGGTVSAPTKASTTSTSITVNAVTAPSTGQTVQYASSTTTTAPGSTSSSWQDSTTISGLTANTNYYIFARAKENDNYNAGAASSASAQIKTDAAPTATTTVINFESDAINKDYDYTEGDNKPTSVKVVTDPIRSNQKSLQITSNGPNDKGYNQAAVIPVKLPYTVKDYQTVSFKFSLVSGNTGTNLDTKQIQVYIAKDKTTFKKWGFGNDSSAGNHFADNLIGAAPSSAVNFDSSYVGKWTDYSITITNPGNAIKDLTGDLYIAIGINCKTNAVYLFDDITFTPKSGFTPPPPPPSAPSTAPNPPSTGAVSSKNYRNMFTEYGYSSADVTAKVNNAWNKLFVNGTSDEKIYVESGSDMAYIYTADSDDVRSEGMSYGMMMCVQMNDQTRFNKLWKWARTHMYNTVNNGSNNRGYFSWQCGTNGNKKDQGPAPDGEVYFVTSLLFAHARWGSSSSGINNYAQEARQIIYDLTRRDSRDPYGEPSMFNTTNYLIRFATIGNSATHTDPSYHLPAFLECWALELESDYNANKLYGIWADKNDLKKDVDFFKKAAEESRKYFVTTTNSTTGLGPDYSLFDGSPTGGNHADFRFDAWRIALNIGMDYAWWAKDSWQKTFANRIQAFFKSKGISTYKNQWQLNGTVIEGDHSPGLVGCNAVASLAASHVNAWEFIEDFWNIPMTTGKYRYYDGCLYMMCMLHLSGNFKAYLTSNTTPANNSSITPTTASFDKKTSASTYKDIAVTVTLNGNSFSSITNDSTALTSSTDYTTSGNPISNVTIKKEYLAKQPVGTTKLAFNFTGGASPELTVTITDTGSSSISPTTATFDKKTGAQADIKVTFTPNGNSVSNIKNGSTTLTNGTDYSVSGNDYTIKKEYLAKQAVGTTTLTFTFSGGSTTTQSIAITVKDTTGGTAGTSYNFATDNLPNGYPKYSSSDISATITGGVLKVTKTGGYSTPKITLPFSITGNLSGYTSIKINVQGVSGDYGNKQLYAAIGSTNLGSVNNAPIPNGSFGDVVIPISGGGTNTGDIEISFWLNNTNAYVIDIKSIELIK